MIVRSAYRVPVQPLRVPDPPEPPKFDWLKLDLGPFNPPRPKPLTTAEICRRVEGFYGMAPGTIGNRSRNRDIARPRQIAMYLSRTMGGQSLPRIGRMFGGYDHTTVLHAVRQVTKLIETDGDFAEEVEVLREGLAG
jgi:chromosomal replication initiator protein